MGKLIEEPSLKNRSQVFVDRAHAGRLLAREPDLLAELAEARDPEVARLR